MNRFNIIVGFIMFSALSVLAAKTELTNTQRQEIRDAISKLSQNEKDYIIEQTVIQAFEKAPSETLDNRFTSLRASSFDDANGNIYKLAYKKGRDWSRQHYDTSLTQDIYRQYQNLFWPWQYISHKNGIDAGVREHPSILEFPWDDLERGRDACTGFWGFHKASWPKLGTDKMVKAIQLFKNTPYRNPEDWERRKTWQTGWRERMDECGGLEDLLSSYDFQVQ